MIKNKLMPTIFALDISTFNKKLEDLDFVSDIHLDFMDGKFTSKKSIDISEMSSILACPQIKFEIHLMAHNPIQYLKQIKWVNLKKVLIQYEVFESVGSLKETIEEFKKNGIEIFLVINPDTQAEKVLEVKDSIAGVMFMSVVPGAEGQEFIESTYDKISFLRKECPEMPIQVDGGVNSSNAQKLKLLGVNYFSVGSSISSSESPKDSFERLNDLIKNQ